MRSRPVLMVRKLVSVPPSQRLTTKKLPERVASSLDDLLRLALGADHQQVAAAAHGLDDEVVRAREEARRLVEVDDVDAVARAVDVRAHLRVPALGLVAEVDARVEQRAKGERHVAKLRQALGSDLGRLGHRALPFGWASALRPCQRRPFTGKERRTGLRFARESVCGWGESGDATYVKDGKMQGDGGRGERRTAGAGDREGGTRGIGTDFGGFDRHGRRAWAGGPGGCGSPKAPPNMPPPEYERVPGAWVRRTGRGDERRAPGARVGCGGLRGRSAREAC